MNVQHKSVRWEAFLSLQRLAPLFFLCACLLFSLSASAQSGIITGVVKDATGSSLSNASIVVLNEGTGVERNAASDKSGYYSVPALPQGTYDVLFHADGFQDMERKAIHLEQAQVYRLDVALSVSKVATSIVVTSEAPALDRETTAVNTVMESRTIRELPTNGRNAVAFLNLVPGIRGMSNLGGFAPSAYSDGVASISGVPPSGSTWLFDGIADENQTSGGPAVSPSVDATAEIHIVTSTPSAEYGRTGGGVVSYVSKSGTNEFHGSLWEFAENNAFNSNDYFSKRSGVKVAPFSQHQYGLTVGGPVVKNKLFFFFNWEGFRRSTQSRSLYTVPTDRQRQGDFSQTFDATGALVTIYDPLSTGGPNNTRTPFAGNVIPSNRVSPVAKTVASYYPAPNVASATGVNNFLTSANTSYQRNAYGLRMDYYLTPTRQVAGRYTQDTTPTNWPQPFGDDNIATPGTSKTTYVRNSAFLSYSDVLRPTLLMEWRVGFNRFGIDRIPVSRGFDAATLRFPSSLNTQQQFPIFPYFGFTTVSGIGSQPGDAASQRGYAHSLSGSLSYIHSRHDIKTGFEGRLYRWDSVQGPGLLRFDFDRNWTKGPSATAAATNGYDFASFMLGNPASGTLYRYQNYLYSTYYYAGYVQDNWKILPRLTLNLGLRWDHETATTARHNNIANFDPDLTTTYQGLQLKGGMEYPGVNGLSRGSRDTTWNNFGPRVGLVYELTPATVFRAGFSISYLPMTGNFVRLSDTGFSSATAYTASLDGGLTPSGSLSNPFPQGIVAPTGSSLGALTGLGTSITGNPRGQVSGTSQQWSLNVQQQLASWTVQVGYTGTHGLHLPASYAYGHLNQSYLSQGSALTQLVANPYAGIITTGALASPTIARGTLLRDFPQFTGVTSTLNWGGSNYQAGTLRVQRKYSTGLSLLASYTWSKYLDNTLGNGANTFADSGSNSVQNWDNLKAEKAISTSSQPHRMVVSAGYEIPVPATASRWIRSTAGGWRVNGILSAYSGNVIAVTANAPLYGGSRPNLIGDPGMAHPTVNAWLNKNAFQAIPAYTFGNAPRNLPRTFTQPTVNLDASVTKTLTFQDRYKAEFRAEAFNALNSTTFGSPGSVFGNADFGVISSLRSGTAPRVLQFGIKGYF